MKVDVSIKKCTQALFGDTIVKSGKNYTHMEILVDAEGAGFAHLPLPQQRTMQYCYTKKIN